MRFPNALCPGLGGERLTDDGHGWRSMDVGTGEQAAGDHRHAERPEVLRAHRRDNDIR